MSTPHSQGPRRRSPSQGQGNEPSFCIAWHARQSFRSPAPHLPGTARTTGHRMICESRLLAAASSLLMLMYWCQLLQPCARLGQQLIQPPFQGSAADVCTGCRPYMLCASSSYYRTASRPRSFTCRRSAPSNSKKRLRLNKKQYNDAWDGAKTKQYNAYLERNKMKYACFCIPHPLFCMFLCRVCSFLSDSPATLPTPRSEDSSAAPTLNLRHQLIQP
jgi:hypothetical protein